MHYSWHISRTRASHPLGVRRPPLSSCAPSSQLTGGRRSNHSKPPIASLASIFKIKECSFGQQLLKEYKLASYPLRVESKKGRDIANTYICFKRFGFGGKSREQLIDILQVCAYKAREDREIVPS